MQWTVEWLCNGYLITATEEEDVQERRQTFQEDLEEMRVSWSGVRGVASDGVARKLSSLDGPAGARESQSRYVK